MYTIKRTRGGYLRRDVGEACASGYGVVAPKWTPVASEAYEARYVTIAIGVASALGLNVTDGAYSIEMTDTTTEAR